MSKIIIGILAHVDAGKTTLSESMLYLTGKIRKMGRVDNKDAFLDTYELEKERGITIFSKQAEFYLGKQEITLLDTPGHVDFSAEMERTLNVLDYAILVVSGADGVQGHTQTLWKLLNQYHIPTFLFVNKMDQQGTDQETLLLQLQKKLSDGCVDFTCLDDDFYEHVAMCDEQVLEHYLETAEVSKETIKKLIKERKLFPCFFGSALKLTGVQEFLEGLEELLEPTVYTDTFGARVFKISRDSQGKRLTHLKITGGSLKVRDEISGVRYLKDHEQNGEETEVWTEKVNQIRIYNGVKYEACDEVKAGTVCSVLGLQYTRAGESLGTDTMQRLPVLEPVLTYRVWLPKGDDPLKVMTYLQELEEEDPELHIVWEETLREIHIQLMGEIQTEILKRIVLERFNVHIEFGMGRILYKETIQAPVLGVGHFEPLRHYAEVQLLLEPEKPGSGLSFDSVCPENYLSKNWQRLIMTHLKERVHKGVLTGSPITDIKITIVAGKDHMKHTEGGDFRQATYRAVRQGLKKAQSVLLEPYYQFRLEIPRQMLGRAMMDMEKLYAQFELSEGTDEEAVLVGQAPVATMGEYQKSVAAYTSGQGHLFCSLAGYFECHNADEVILRRGYDSERDLANPTGSVFCAHGKGFVVPWFEVDDYKHLEIIGGKIAMKDYTDETLTVKEPVKNKKQITASDDELKAIFERTYGPIKTRVENKPKVIRAKEQEAVYKPKKPAKHKDEYLLVDGYNIIFGWEVLNELAEHSMDAARMKLMETLSNYAGYTDIKVILVFDAYRVEGFPGEYIRWQNIDVVYTKEAETADQFIEKTAHAMGKQYKVTVATSDGVEQIIIRSKGCFLLSARELLEEIERTSKQLREAHLSKEMKNSNYLLDYLPEEEKEKMEAIRLGLTTSNN